MSIKSKKSEDIIHKNRQRTTTHLRQLIGHTPMLEICYRYRGEERRMYAKYEQFNLTGSIKDRVALHILEQAYLHEDIKAGATIAEATSGNTGISFAAIGRALGHPVTIVMPDWMSRERVDLIRSFGARVELVSKEEGGFLGSIHRVEQMKQNDPDLFLPRQFSNPLNAAAHEQTTGVEIWDQLNSFGRRPDAFVAGVGTGGTVMGISACLKRRDPNIRVHPLEPAESPTLSTGHKVGNHRIQGISDEFVPDIIDFDQLDDIIQVSDGDAILMAQRLTSELGLGVGVSSGANFLGAVQLQNRMGAEACVATVFADCNKKYLSTDLMREETLRKEYASPKIELLTYSVTGRSAKRATVPTQTFEIE